jgi:hypothetical protein
MFTGSDGATFPQPRLDLVLVPADRVRSELHALGKLSSAFPAPDRGRDDADALNYRRLAKYADGRCCNGLHVPFRMNWTTGRE